MAIGNDTSSGALPALTALASVPPAIFASKRFGDAADVSREARKLAKDGQTLGVMAEDARVKHAGDYSPAGKSAFDAGLTDGYKANDLTARSSTLFDEAAKIRRPGIVGAALSAGLLGAGFLLAGE
jgi:hypothetical protein